MNQNRGTYRYDEKTGQVVRVSVPPRPAAELPVVSQPKIYTGLYL